MIRAALRFVYRTFLPADIGRSLDLFRGIRAGAVKRCLAGDQDLRERKLLVLAPHPDDDVIGCGGTLCRYHRLGAHITVAYLTDGSKGNDRYPEGELVRTRKEETERAARLLGLERLIFLGHKDSELSRSPKAADDLQGVVNDVRPDAVFLPFLQDNHADHMATNSVFMKACRSLPGATMIYAYEVWTPLARPNCVVEITELMALKKRAIEQHASQTELADLVDGYTGLARYRAVLSDVKEGYAEAFFRCSLTEYRRLWRSIA